MNELILQNEKERIKKIIIEWVIANHNHHMVNEKQGIEGFDFCADSSFPYVNSRELERFILSL